MSQTGIQWIVTANFTADGAVAYRREDGSWSGQLAESALFADEDATKPAVTHAAQKEQRLVSDPYPIDVRVGENGIEALTARERIRAYGPTTPLRRPDSGMPRRAS